MGKLSAIAATTMMCSSLLAANGAVAQEPRQINGISWSEEAYLQFYMFAKVGGGLDADMAAKEISREQRKRNAHCSAVEQMDDVSVVKGLLCVKFKCGDTADSAKHVVIAPGRGQVKYNSETCLW